MRKFILYATASLFLLSCGAEMNSNNSELSKQDSIAQAEKDSISRVQKYKDSIISVDQNRVIDDITFDDNEKEFQKKADAFMEKCKVLDERLSSNGSKFYDYKIGDYEIHAIRPSFKDGKLYRVVIYGYPVHYENYKADMPKEFSAIYEPLRNKYGPADDYVGIPQWHTTDNDYTYLAAAWYIGKKTIELRVSDEGLSYRLNMVIYLPSVVEEIKNAEERKRTSTADSVQSIL